MAVPHFYHGGPSIKGRHIMANTVHHAYATTSLKEALEFKRDAKRSSPFAYNKVGNTKRPAVYRVQTRGRSGNWHVYDRSKKYPIRTIGGGFSTSDSLSRLFGQHLRSRVRLAATRLPSARGHAARPPQRRR